MAGRRLVRFLKGRRLEMVSLCIAAIVWQIAADFVVKDPILLPSFYDVLLSFFELWRIIPLDILISLLHFGIGLAIAACVGIPIGIAMGWFRRADRAADPIVEILRPIPPLAWIPFAIVWFGLTHYSAGFIVFIGALFPILINTYAGFRDVPKTLVEAAKVLGCTKDRDLIKSVAFPSSLPSIATGIRVGMGIGWMCVVAAEMFGVSKNGLGFRLYQRFYYAHQMDNLLLYMIILGLIGLFLDRIFRYFVEKKLFRWRKGIVA
jgi:NitT/TauT family transport system permease protein